MDELGIVGRNVSKLLGPDPCPMEELVRDLYTLEKNTEEYTTAWHDMLACIREAPDRLYVKLFSLVAFGQYNKSKSLLVLQEVLRCQSQILWNRLTSDTKCFIKEMLLGCVSHTRVEEFDITDEGVSAIDQAYDKMRTLSKITVEIADRELGTIPETWVQLYPFITASIYSDSKTLQVFALSVIVCAPHMVIANLENATMDEVKSLSDQIVSILPTNEQVRETLALKAIVTLWTSLSHIAKILVTGPEVSTICASLYVVAQHDKNTVGDLLIMVNSIDMFDSVTNDQDVQNVTRSLLKIMQLKIRLDTKSQVVNPILHLLGKLPQSSLNFVCSSNFFEDFFSEILDLLDENQDANISMLGKRACEGIRQLLGPVRSIRQLGRRISVALIRKSKHHSVIIAIGMLASGLSPDQVETTTQCLSWISIVLRDPTKVVSDATLEAIKILSPCIRNNDPKVTEECNKITNRLKRLKSAIRRMSSYSHAQLLSVEEALEQIKGARER